MFDDMGCEELHRTAQQDSVKTLTWFETTLNSGHNPYMTLVWPTAQFDLIHSPQLQLRLRCPTGTFLQLPLATLLPFFDGLPISYSSLALLFDPGDLVLSPIQVNI